MSVLGMQDLSPYVVRAEIKHSFKGKHCGKESEHSKS